MFDNLIDEGIDEKSYAFIVGTLVRQINKPNRKGTLKIIGNGFLWITGGLVATVISCGLAKEGGVYVVFQVSNWGVI